MRLFLGLIFVTFIAILGICWDIARRTDPVILDAKGNYRQGTYR